MIQFGKYDQRISFLTMGQVGDGYAGYIPTPEISLTTYASVMQMKGSNDLESAQLQLPKTYRFKIHYRNDFEPDTTQRIVYRGFYHQILAIEETNERYRNEYIITAIKTDEEYTLIPISGIGAWIIGTTFKVS